MSANDENKHNATNTQEHDPCSCETRHPLERDGTGQSQRLLPALKPDYVKPDERKLEDMLLFARQFSEKLRFFSNKNEPAGDWVSFIENDVTTLVAEISKLDLSEDRKAIQHQIETMEHLLAKNPNADIDETLPATIFNHILGLLEKINIWITRTDKILKLHIDMDLIFKSVFVPGVKRIAGVLKAADILFDDLAIEDGNKKIEAAINTEWIEYFKRPEIVGVTVTDTIDWENNTTVPPLKEVFQVSGNAQQKVRSVTNYLHGLYEQQANALQSLVNKKDFYINETLESYPYHKAHIGLFLSFLRVFTYAQQHQNGLTARHLDYYYERVLGLTRKAETPDKAHIIFELAKNVSEHLLADETELNAGKDLTGVQLVFKTCDQLLVNTAKATTFKNILIESASGETATNFYGIYASPVANSSDGIGGELDADVPKWDAFGTSQFGLIDQKRTMPDARVGLAIASPQLILNEGTRKITLTFHMESDINTNDILDAVVQLPATSIICRLTGKKGWFTPSAIKLEIKRVLAFDESANWGYDYKSDFIGSYYEIDALRNPKTDPLESNLRNKGFTTSATEPEKGGSEKIVMPKQFLYHLIVTIDLNATEQAIKPYSAATHLGSYLTPFPVVAIEFPNYVDTAKVIPAEDLEKAAKEKRNFYSFLKSVTIKNGKIGVDVKGLKNIIVQNDTAKLKPDAPFLPFGVQPSESSAFYIGNEEIFYKKLNQLKIYAAWHEKPADFDKHYAVYKEALKTENDTDPKTYDYPWDTLNFKATAEMRIDRNWQKLIPAAGDSNELDLFPSPKGVSDPADP